MEDRVDQRRRRLLLAGAGAVAGMPLVAAGRLLQPTPAQSAGPFYPPSLPLDDDNDLTWVQGREGQARGRITELTGRILDLNGRPLPGMRIEIWQCDANGRYRHPKDSNGTDLDENFQGHGHSYSNDDGWYRFRTIRPVPYPGRTPHIHVALLPEGEAPFVTQLYIAGEPRNEQDLLFNAIPIERRPLVLSQFDRSHHHYAEFAARFDIILDRKDGTPTA